MTCELTVADCFGRTVQLDHSNWQRHLATRRHLEVIPYHDDFPAVLRDPDLVIEGARTGQYHYYRGGMGTGIYAKHSLLLIVGTYETGHKLTTWRFTQPGSVLWSK